MSFSSACSSGRLIRNAPKYVGAERLAAAVAGRFGQADFDHLPRVVPFVDGRTDIQPS